MKSGAWRASYTPGSGVLLCGPRCMVILRPAGQQHSRLIGELWDTVSRATKIDEVAERLAELGLSQTPSLGVFCWSDGRLRVMARGVDVYDADTDGLMISGAEDQTSSEVAVHAARVRIEVEPVPDEPGLVLPMVAGAAQISTLLLDAAQALESAGPVAEQSGENTEELASADVPIPAVGAQDSAGGACAPAVQPSVEEDIELFRVEPADALATEPPTVAPPVLAVLRSADRDPVPVDRAVLIGRAPLAEPNTGSDPLIMAVHSPSHDISRSHLQVSVSDGRLQVTDLHSTNGTTLIRRDPALGSERLPAGEPVTVKLGDVLDLGDGVTIAIDVPG